MSSGSFGNGANYDVISQDGVLRDANGDEITSLVGVLAVGQWMFYDEQGGLFNPDFAAGEYIEWDGGSAIGGGAASTSHVKCYIRDRVLNEPTNLAAAVAGKGYCRLDTYTAAQFANEGNIGLSDGGFHSLVVFDTDGVPSMLGEKVSTNVTTIDATEGTAYGALYVWEGNIFSPTRYPDTTAGKYVVNAKIVNIDTVTTSADQEWMAVASNNGRYSLDRHDLQVVLNGSPSGTSDIYELDPDQRGQWFRFAYAHGDKGGASVTKLRMYLQYEDGTTGTYAINSFIHQAGALVAHSVKEQEIIHNDTDTGIWTKGGDIIGVPNTQTRHIAEIPCLRQPITFNAYLQSGVVGFTSLFGGNSDVANFKFSIDGGLSWQAGATFNVSGSNSREILPMVMDTDGQISTVLAITEWVDCASGSWSADLITPDNNDTVFDDGIDDRGWSVEYSNLLGVEQLESKTTSPLTWTLDKVYHDASYLYHGNTFTESDTKSVAPLSPILPSATVGQNYVLAFNPYMYYLGTPSNDIRFTAKIIDQTTGATLGIRTFVWGGNTTVSLSNELLPFVGAGNPIRLEFETSTDPITGDWWGNLTNATLTSATLLKTAATGWNTRISSGEGKRPIDGEVVLKFKVDGVGNRGMHGLDNDYVGASYGGGDHLFYISSNTAIHIYEDGSNRAISSTFNINQELMIKISTAGVVTYWVAGVLRYTSTITADVNKVYWASFFPYQVGSGIKDIVFNGDTPITLPDAAGHYVRLDNVRLMEGLYSDATHHAKIVGNDIFFRNIDGVATATFDQHEYSGATTIRPEFNMIKYGTWTDDQKIKLSYQIDNDAWVEMLFHEGNFDAANELYLSPFTYGKNVDLAAGEKIRYRVQVYGNAVGNTGVYLRGVSDNIIC
jgi:hypothetical protein